MSFFKCDRCGFEGFVEIEEGFILCEGCESVYNNCINEPNEKRTREDFIKEIKENLKGGNKE